MGGQDGIGRCGVGWSGWMGKDTFSLLLPVFSSVHLHFSLINQRKMRHKLNSIKNKRVALCGPYANNKGLCPVRVA